MLKKSERTGDDIKSRYFLITCHFYAYLCYKHCVQCSRQISTIVRMSESSSRVCFVFTQRCAQTCTNYFRDINTARSRFIVELNTSSSLRVENSRCVSLLEGSRRRIDSLTLEKEYVRSFTTSFNVRIFSHLLVTFIFKTID